MSIVRRMPAPAWWVGLVMLAVVLAVSAHGVLAADPEQRELLALHLTVARYAGTERVVCRGLTAQCPEKCGHSGELATFTIVRYLSYEKLGAYGDAKQDAFQVLYQDNMQHVKVTPEILAAIKGLRTGQTVLLGWRHDYVTKGGVSSPERPIVMLSPLTEKDAQALQPKQP